MNGGGSQLFGRGLLYVVVWSLQLVVGTLVSPVLAHVLGPSEFGALASAIALFQVLSVLALLGLDQATVLQRAEEGDSRSARGLVTVGIVLAALVAMVAGLSAPLWQEALGFGGHTQLVLAVVLWTGPAAAVQIMLALLVAEDRLRPFAIISAIAAVGGQLFGIVLLFTVHNDATTYAWGGVISQFAAMIVAIAVTRPSLRGLVSFGVTRRAIALGLPLAFGGLAYFVLNAGDRVVIQSILGPAEVGRYQVAYVVGSVVLLLLTFTSSAWTPRFAAVRDFDARAALAVRSRDELYRLLVPVLWGITLAAPLALRIVAPASFRPDSLAIIVYIVALTAFPVTAGGAAGRLLITSRKGTAVGTIAAIAAVVNIGLNLLLVPLVGIVGSALATFLAFALLAFLQIRAMPASREWRASPGRLILTVAVTVVGTSATLLLPQTLEWNIARLVAALGCLPWFLIRLKRARLAPENTDGAVARSEASGSTDHGESDQTRD